MKQLYFKTSEDWRRWLKNNHHKENGLWLVFYKKVSGEPSMEYEPAVEEALCFGWIDSIIKKIDENKYVRKFTPRKDNSKWSESNKKRVAKLIENGRMTESGLKKIEAAKRNGNWDKQNRSAVRFNISEELKSALSQNKKAMENFSRLSSTDKKRYIAWIETAKRKETKERRIKESINLLKEGRKLGLK